MQNGGLGWCPHCYCTLSDWQESGERCPYCGDSLSSQENITLVPCLNPNCRSYVEYGDTDCVNCKIDFTDEDWDYFLSTADEKLVQSILDMESFNDPIMICCTNSFMNCSCDKPIMWEDTSRIPTNLWDDVYEYNEPPSSCSSCMYYYTENCIPLRFFLKEFFTNGQIIEQLNRCSYYEIEPELSNNAIFISHGEF